MSVESQTPSTELLTNTAPTESDPPQKSTTESPTNSSAMVPTTTPSNENSLSRGGRNGAEITSRRNKTALDKFEDSIGGREHLIDTLSLANLDKKQEHFLRLLCDPARQRDSLVTIARDCGLLPVHVLDLFRHASFAKAHALSMGHVSEALPSVVKDMAEKSVDATIECPNCMGEQYIADGVKCPVCNARGKIFRPSDLDRQKVMLEVGGILRKGPGVAVQVNNQVNNNVQAPNMFSKYVKDSDDAAYDMSGIIEAEPAKDSDGK